MPLNNSYDEQAVIQAIASALETFYGTLIEKKSSNYEGMLKEYKDASSSRTRSETQRKKRLFALLSYCGIDNDNGK